VEDPNNNSLGYEILSVQVADNGTDVAYILQGSNGAKIRGLMQACNEKAARQTLTAQISEANKRRKRMQEWPGWNWAHAHGVS